MKIRMFAWPKGGRWTSGKVEISEATLMAGGGAITAARLAMVGEKIEVKK